ncbi:MAG: alpha/beta family hydrolase [Acidimicrobiia bacterium]
MTVVTGAVCWSGGSVTARVYAESDTTVLLAHGAGTNQDHRLMVGLAGALAETGLGVITFNYPYTELGRKAPDRAPVLLDCHRAVATWAGERTQRLFLAGRSMGGRMATMLAADGLAMAGVIAYAYPLHPAGKPDQLRIEHLPRMAVPSLFFQGDRDTLARSDLFDGYVRPLTGVEVVDLVGADHSWRMKGRTEAQLLAEVASATEAWIGRLASQGRTRA